MAAAIFQKPEAAFLQFCSFPRIHKLAAAAHSATLRLKAGESWMGWFCPLSAHLSLASPHRKVGKGRGGSLETSRGRWGGSELGLDHGQDIHCPTLPLGLMCLKLVFVH